MVSRAHQRLSDDHEAVGEVLTQLLTALDDNDAPSSLSKLDLLWARLAVHIRAEHLHLFPAVIMRSKETTSGEGIPDPGEVQSVVEMLREDHDFFMHELARAVNIIRGGATDDAALTAIGNTIREIEKRLATHNEIEESTIYPWASKLLTEPEQLELAARIKAELENRPPRFSLEAWANHNDDLLP